MGNIIRWTRTSLKRLQAILFPPHCVACSELLEPDGNWCPSCWQTLIRDRQFDYCPACASTLGPHHKIVKGRCGFCQKAPQILQGVCRVADYRGILGHVVRNFKYNRDLHAGRVAAELLADALWEIDWTKEIDFFVPIPSRYDWSLSRGFSHTRLLAEHLSRAFQKPAPDALKQTRPRRPQVGLSATARLENIKGAFRATYNIPLSEAKICLVDDVMTTGATLTEAAKTLLDAGAKSVHAAIIARSVPENPFL